MTYLMKYRYVGHSGELVEMTMPEWQEIAKKQVGEELFAEQTYPFYVQVTPELARKWVKNGHQHMTPLYVNDEGKVRYAKDSN